MDMDNSILLNNGIEMPLLGLGLYKAGEDAEATQSVIDAAQVGYRLFDTASAYKNEEAVGAGIRALDLPREEVFVTTKVWNTAQRMNTVREAFDRSLERLGLDYVDLYLIHWPVQTCYLDTWRILEEIYASGRAKAIGVSNFGEIELQDILDNCDVVPAVNQIEMHPLNDQSELAAYCQLKGIAVQAYAPLARGAYLNRDVLINLAEKYQRSVAQIGLRWIVQKGIAVIPKTTRPERMLENSQIFDFELSDIEMSAIDTMNENYRAASPPEDML